MKTAAIVIARKGSRRVKGKNARLFCGHPLVAWSIVQALSSHRVDKTFFSTDGDQLAEIGEHYGAEVIRRPDWDDADEVPANIPIVHAMEIIKEEHPEVENVIHILPTSPVRCPDDFDRGVALLDDSLPWPGRASQVCPIVPEVETIALTMITDKYCAWNLWDKSGRYATQGGGMSMWKFEDYFINNEIVIKDRWTDKQIDNMMVENMLLYQRDVLKTDVMRYFPLQIWQQFDIDVPEHFDLCEVIMEHYLLKGRGMDVYRDYKELRDSG